MTKYVQYGNTCAIWKYMCNMTKHVQYGNTCAIW